jgi:hypothetical protein
LIATTIIWVLNQLKIISGLVGTVKTSIVKKGIVLAEIMIENNPECVHGRNCGIKIFPTSIR